MENIPQLKKVPNAMTKDNFVKLCYPVPDQKVRSRINLIIYDNRKKQAIYKDLPKSKIIGTHIIERVELIEYFQTYGLPAGYEF